MMSPQGDPVVSMATTPRVVEKVSQLLRHRHVLASNSFRSPLGYPAASFTSHVRTGGGSGRTIGRRPAGLSYVWLRATSPIPRSTGQSGSPLVSAVSSVAEMAVVVRAFSSVGIGQRLPWQTPKTEPQSNKSASETDVPVAWHDVIIALDRLAPEIAATCRARQVPSRERSLLTGRGWLLDFYPSARLQLRIDWTGGWAFMHRPVPRPGAYRALPGHGAKKISKNDARLHWETRVARDPAVRSEFTETALRESFRNQLARLSSARTY
ncbi:hypothetical protein [Nocardia nova]|uniref:hypothetical protein n=1 Tax=Nocardia nova TaxID=37330 RepID=UPI0011B0596D|nr:hypothetical protein [Nocardia nova]